MAVQVIVEVCLAVIIGIFGTNVIELISKIIGRYLSERSLRKRFKLMLLKGDIDCLKKFQEEVYLTKIISSHNLIGIKELQQQEHLSDNIEEKLKEALKTGSFSKGDEDELKKFIKSLPNSK